MEYSSEEIIKDLRDIVESRMFQKILDERKEFAQREVNRFVREQNLVEAFGALMRMEDNDKLIELIKIKINQIQGEQRNGRS